MKKQNFIKMFCAVLALSLVFGACKKDEDEKAPIQKAPVGVDYCYEEDFPIYAGNPFDKKTGEIKPNAKVAGTVNVANDEENLYVTYITEGGWKMANVHLYIGETPPVKAAPGQFPYSAYVNGTEYTFTFPLEDLAECLYIAAHSELTKYNAQGQAIDSQTGWAGNGQMIEVNGNWSMMFQYCAESCLDFHSTVSFGKMKLVNGEEESAGPEEFAFELWTKPNNGQGTPYSTYIETYYTDMGGMVIAGDLKPGFYVFKEVETNGWRLDIPWDGLYFEVKNANDVIIWRDYEFEYAWEYPVVVNVPNDNPLTPAYGSVTATNNVNNPTIVHNSNHFCYATFSRAALEAGVTMDLVVGNKIDKVGTATAQIVGGNIVVTINNYAVGDFGIIAYNKVTNNGFPKNGNIHSQKEGDLIKSLGATTGFNHNNNLVVPCPSGNTIYLYIHCGTIQFYL